MERPFEAYEGDEPYVFVCYSHDDKALVYPELIRLRDSGVRIWYDEGVSPGSEWSEAIAQKIQGSAVFLYFITPQSVISEHCRREVNFADTKSRRLLAVHLVRTELPSGLELILSNRQAILKYEETRAAYEAKLARALGDARAHNVDGNASPDRPSAPRRWPIWWLTVAAVAIAVAGLSVWFANRPTQEIPLPDRSLAVMPFSVVGDDPEAANYADSLTEELRSAVAGYKELRVISVGRSTPTGYEPSYSVGGNVERLGDRIRVRASLTRTGDHQTIWADTFSRTPATAASDLHATASLVGHFIRSQVYSDQLCQTVRHTSRNLEAANAYCAARAEGDLWDQGGGVDPHVMLDEARHALALDPNIVGAYSLVSYGYRALGVGGQMDWREAARGARAAIDRGLALSPNDARLLTELGSVQATLELDYPGADSSYRASLASDPLNPHTNYWNHLFIGRVALAKGDLTEASTEFKLGLRMNDADAGVYLYNAAALQFAGENRKAIEMADLGLQIVKTGQVRLVLLMLKTMAHAANGEIAAANAALDDALESVGPQYKPLLAGLLAWVGRTDEARRLLAPFQTLKDPPVAVMAYGYAGMHDARAFEWIHTAIDRHVWSVIQYLRLHPFFVDLQKDPRWADVMTHLESEEAKGRAGQNALSSDAA